MNAQNAQWSEINRAALSPILSWNEMAAQTADKFARYGLALTQDIMEMGARQLQLAGAVKDPQQWAQEESKLLTEYGQKLAARSSDYLALSKEIRESVANWGETTAKAAAETIQPKAA
jgi:hypothetical protein